MALLKSSFMELNVLRLSYRSVWISCDIKTSVVILFLAMTYFLHHFFGALIEVCLCKKSQNSIHYERGFIHPIVF